MRVDVLARPAYAMATLVLSANEEAYIERSAMVAMSSGIHLSAGFGGEGITKALTRRYLGGETLLFTKVHAEFEGAWISVSPPYPGDAEEVPLAPNVPLLAEAGSLLAYSRGVSSGVSFTGLRTMVMHEGITLLHLDGPGSAVLAAYGGIEPMTVQEGEEVIVDTGHIVAFTESMKFDVGPMGGITAAITTGSGFVARFTGPGQLLLQTRAEKPFRDWILPPDSATKR
jgi:uncharacterized protein (TIGR00266 family)